MANRKKKTAHEGLAKSVTALSAYRPDEILKALSTMYNAYSKASTTEAEIDFWLKCSRATENLSSGMNKWMYEMAEELEEADEKEEEEI